MMKRVLDSCVHISNVVNAVKMCQPTVIELDYVQGDFESALIGAWNVLTSHAYSKPYACIAIKKVT